MIETANGHDEDPVGHVADAGARPVAERGEEAGAFAESGLRVRGDPGVEVEAAYGETLEREHEHAGAGDGPGAEGAGDAGRMREPARERETPAPTMEPTTMGASVQNAPRGGRALDRGIGVRHRVLAGQALGAGGRSRPEYIAGPVTRARIQGTAHGYPAARARPPSTPGPARAFRVPGRVRPLFKRVLRMLDRP